MDLKYIFARFVLFGKPNGTRLVINPSDVLCAFPLQVYFQFDEPDVFFADSFILIM